VRALRIIIIEDHPMMLAAMCATFEKVGLSVIASAGSAAEGYRLVGELSPDLVVTDLGLPDESGTDLTRRLLQRNADLPVVMHTGLVDPVSLKGALDCGARGFAYKTGGPESLVSAVRAVAAGGAYVAPELRAAIAQLEGTRRPRCLTDRERQVLTLVADGLPNDTIAGRLMLSPETVRTHVRNAMGRLGTHTRAHAVVEALRNEEIDL
jgi:DNA-binding NarL/FixJ family response regulator